MKSYNFIILVTTIILLISFDLLPQTARVTTRGSSNFRKTAIHNGNQVHTVFTNYGVIAQPAQDIYPRGAWKYDANGYIGDVSPVVGVLNPIKDYPAFYDMNGDKIKDTVFDGITDTIHTVVVCPADRGTGNTKTSPGGGKSWTFEPIPGFANADNNKLDEGVALSNLEETWPLSWPDEPSFTLDTPLVKNGDTLKNVKVDWNGYFGKGRIKTANQESYFWMDDNNDEEMFDTHGFLPDSMDSSRRGHALQVSVRGLQWDGDPVAQNVLFWLYNIKNDGTTTYDQAVFGVLVGTYVGIRGNEWNDDASFFDVRESITYTWDFDDYISPSANPAWQPDPSSVGYVAYAFLESPGNGIDGIDNDHDNASVSAAPFFTAQDFDTLGRVLATGDEYVLIDKATFKRTVHTVGTTRETVISMGAKFNVGPGDTLQPEGNFNRLTNSVNPNSLDGIDNDLDGIIDESYTTHYKQFKKSPDGLTTLIDTVNATQYIKDWVSYDNRSAASSDLMIDEKRDDGIDNDKDWNPAFDDLGSDGLGKPEKGAGNGKPDAGEPNFDEKDIHESDQLGLTSFQYFVPSSDIKMKENEDLWKRLHPGNYDVPKSIVKNVAQKGEDGDFIYGSGYFPLAPNQVERFSLALAFGDDLEDVITTKQVVQLIYSKNYRFPKAPDTPTLTVVPGDKRVTLYWDHAAEESIDPESREKDFEGYKLYRSTSYDFADQRSVTNAQGKVIEYTPYKQFDLIDNVTGNFPLSNLLSHLYSGYAPFLGKDAGVQNSYEDTAVTNGRTYYYILTAYDRGDANTDTYPKESPFSGSITRNTIGTISHTQNAGFATPIKPGAGSVKIPSDQELTKISGNATGKIKYEVVDPYNVQNTSYIVTFKGKYTPEIIGSDTLWQGPLAESYSVRDSITGRPKVNNSTLIRPNDGLVFDGVRLSFDTSYQSIDSIKIVKDNYWKINNPIDSTKPLLDISISNTVSTSPRTYVTRFAKDYAIVFKKDTLSSNALMIKTDPNSGTGTTLKSIPANFEIYDITDVNHPQRIPFAFSDGNKDATISSGDKVFLADTVSRFEGDKKIKLSWVLSFTNSNTKGYTPYKGTENDTIILRFTKPICATDELSFKIEKAKYDSKLVASQLKNIKVVPNPYVVTNLYEPSPSSGLKGRGPRVIMFNGLPAKCKISIFTSSGDHVRTLDHDGTALDSSMKWDLRTKEGLEVAYGVYFYVVEADGISDKKTGKIAIIK